jgi:GT2 family glycosyltransferase
VLDEPRIGVSLVLFHSRPDQLVRTLRGLADQSVRPRAIHLHLNETTDEEMAAIQSVIPAEATVSHSATNLGFAAAHNENLRRLFADDMDAVLVLNPDLILRRDALQALGEFHSAHPSAIAGPVLLLADPDTGESEGRLDSTGIVWTRSGRHLDAQQGRSVDPSLTLPQRVAGLSGACLLVPRECHRRIVDLSGEFFDADFIAYREDAELAYRAGLLGVESWLVPAAVGLHVRQLRGTARSASAAINRLGVRNRFLIAAKYGARRPGSGVLPWARDLVVLLAVVVGERSSWSGVTDAWRLRRRMRAKGKRVLAAVRQAPS